MSPTDCKLNTNGYGNKLSHFGTQRATTNGTVTGKIDNP